MNDYTRDMVADVWLTAQDGSQPTELNQRLRELMLTPMELDAWVKVNVPPGEKMTGYRVMRLLADKEAERAAWPDSARVWAAAAGKRIAKMEDIVRDTKRECADAIGAVTECIKLRATNERLTEQHEAMAREVSMLRAIVDQQTIAKRVTDAVAAAVYSRDEQIAELKRKLAVAESERDEYKAAKRKLREALDRKEGKK